jgi:spoIIIJ-associated protein
MVGSRGGRRRPAAVQGDAFRDALLRGLADAIGVDEVDVELSVSVAGAPIDVGLLPVSIKLAAPAAPDAGEGSASTQDEGDEAVAPAAASSAAAPPEREGSRAPRAGRSAGSAGASGGGPTGDAMPVTQEELDEEADAAADLLEGLLDAMDLPGDLRISVQDAHAEVEVVGLEEGVLIGRRGQTLEAIQELVRTAMQRRFERRSRVMIDVDGYRARRLEKLLERAEEAVQEVLDSGEPQRLEPMDSIERRLVHQRVATFSGVTSSSHGREPARRIVIELLEDD